MPTPKRIAIAEDDEAMGRFFAHIVTGMGHIPLPFLNGETLIKQLQRDTFDLLLLDWNMPGKSGKDVLIWAQANMTATPPVIMISSRTEKMGIAECLGAGADDYIVKPESAAVIAARIAAVLRRAAPANITQRHHSFGSYTFDKLSATVDCQGEVIALTAKEFALALMFFNNQNRPISRAYILQTLWNSVADLPTRTLDMHVSRVRSKLKLQPENGCQRKVGMSPYSPK